MGRPEGGAHGQRIWRIGRARQKTEIDKLFLGVRVTRSITMSTAPSSARIATRVLGALFALGCSSPSSPDDAHPHNGAGATGGNNPVGSGGGAGISGSNGTGGGSFGGAGGSSGGNAGSSAGGAATGGTGG